MVKYRINVVESERGWGQEYWTEDFDTLDEAESRIKFINLQNISATAPDVYMQAQSGVEVVNEEA
jgi:hypothetical protein